MLCCSVLFWVVLCGDCGCAYWERCVCIEHALRVYVQYALRVYQHHAHMFFSCGLGARTHGNVLNVHSWFFSVPRRTHLCCAVFGSMWLCGKTLVDARGDTDVPIVRYTWVLEAKEQSNHLTAGSFRNLLRVARGEQSVQVKRKIGGLGNVLFSIYSQTEIGNIHGFLR